MSANIIDGKAFAATVRGEVASKVAELKKAITEGKYQIDSEKLAKNLADFEFDVYG